jgi:GNAT superfamily N-acetyltransferase
MSCIAGVGGNVKKMVRTALSGRKIIVIDGCPLACSRYCLNNHNIKPDLHFELTNMGVTKKMHEDFEADQAKDILHRIEKILNESMDENTVMKFVNGDTRGKRYLRHKYSIAETSRIIVKEVVTEKELNAFIDLPYRLYKDNSYYVPQLKKDTKETFDKKKNPAFDFCEAKYWLAYKENKAVGRIAAIINHSFIEKWKKPYMRFSWMDFEEDEQIAKVLFRQVESWAREKGMKAVHGPLGFTNFDYSGLLIRGYDQLGTFATTYNYPYYPLFIERAGYQRDVDWVEYKITVPAAVPEELTKMALLVERRNHLSVVRATKTKEIMPYAKDIFRLLNSAYADLYGVVGLNERQIENNIRKYLSFIRADFVSLVLDRTGELVAFGIAMPSLSRALQRAKGELYPFGFIHLLRAVKKNDLVDLCLVAVRTDMQGKGVNAILMNELTRSFIKNDVRYGESNPELEDNAKVQSLWRYYEAVQHKRRRCYIKYL